MSELKIQISSAGGYLPEPISVAVCFGRGSPQTRLQLNVSLIRQKSGLLKMKIDIGLA